MTKVTEDYKKRVRHIYNVEILYAAVVDAYIQWQLALVEAVIRASAYRVACPLAP